MKKRIYKYQQGGAAKAFPTQLPNIQTQPFTPLIQMASQPLDTGLDTFKLFEALKMQKLQEERLGQQMEFDKLRLIADTENRQMINEERLINRADKFKDELLKINALSTDVEDVENAKSDNKLNELYSQFLQSRGNKEILNNYIGAIQKTYSDPRVIRAIQRSKIDEEYQKRLAKDPRAKELAQAGYLDESEYDTFSKDKNITTLPQFKEKPGYQDYIKTIENDKKIRIAKAQSDINKINDELEIDKANETLIKPLRDAFIKNPNKETQQAFNDAVAATRGGLKTTTSNNGGLEYKDIVDTAKQQKIRELMSLDKNLSLFDATLKVESEFAAGKSPYNGDSYIKQGKWGEALDLWESGNASFSPTVKNGINSKINGLTYSVNGKLTTLSIDYSDGSKSDKIVAGNTIVDIEPTSQIIRDIDGNRKVSANIFKKIKSSELEDYEKKGWVISNKGSLGSGENTATVTKLGYVNLGKSNEEIGLNDSAPATNTTNTTTSLPTPVRTKDIEAVKTDLKSSGIILRKENDNDFNISLNQGLVPPTTINFLKGLPSILGDNVIPTGHWHHLRQASTRIGDKVITNKHVSGDFRPYNVDISLDNFVYNKNNREDINKFYNELSKNEKFKNYLKSQGYALVIEGVNDNDYPSIDSLKTNPIQKSKLMGDSPHLSFEYLGNEQKPVVQGTVPTFLK